MNEKTTIADKGDKITIKKCPNCRETLVVNLDKNESEIFTCTNCKFEIKKK